MNRPSIAGEYWYTCAEGTVVAHVYLSAGVLESRTHLGYGNGPVEGLPGTWEPLVDPEGLAASERRIRELEAEIARIQHDNIRLKVCVEDQMGLDALLFEAHEADAFIARLTEEKAVLEAEVITLQQERSQQTQLMALSVEPRKIAVSDADLLAWKYRLDDVLQHDGLAPDVYDTIEELRDFLEETYHQRAGKGC